MIATAVTAPKHLKRESLAPDGLFVGLIHLRTAPKRLRFFLDGWERQFGRGPALPVEQATADASTPFTQTTLPLTRKVQVPSRQSAAVSTLVTERVPLHVHTAELDPEGGLVGCTKSHLLLYQKMLDSVPPRKSDADGAAAGRRYCMVFEDDVQVNDTFGEFVRSGGLTDLLALMTKGGWDVCRFHKTGICKVHGRLSSNLFHVSSLCGRAYLISEDAARACLEEELKAVVPYTYYLGLVTSRHLTYHPSLITEGAFGSSSAKQFGHSDGLKWLLLMQQSLQYTVLFEQAIANVSWYWNLTSPLFSAERFPMANTLRGVGSYDAKAKALAKNVADQVMSWGDYRLNVGDYESFDDKPTGFRLGNPMLGELGKEVRSWGGRGAHAQPAAMTPSSGHSTNLMGALHPSYGRMFCEEQSLPSRPKTLYDYDVVVIGGGVAGSSVYYWLSKEAKASAGSNSSRNPKVLLLDQHKEEVAQEGDERPVMRDGDAKAKADRSERSLKGSSGGGPRRIGLLDLAPGTRVRRAYNFWLDLQAENFATAKTTCSQPPKLLEVIGEVLVVRIFPLGWATCVFFLLWRFFRNVAGSCFPEGLEMLLSREAILKKLPRSAFGRLSWNHFGVYYPEAAAIYADRSCEYLKESSENGGVQGVEKAVSIRIQDSEADATDFRVVIVKTSSGNEFRCRHCVIAAGGGSANLLLSLNDTPGSLENDVKIHAKTNVQHFACPTYSMADLRQRYAVEDVTVHKACPLFSLPGARVYGFPEAHPEGGDERCKDRMFIRPNFPFKETPDVADSWGAHTVEEEAVAGNLEAVERFVGEYFAVKNASASQQGPVTPESVATCRYVQLAVGTSEASCEGFGAVLDFVPGTNGQVVLASGLDGYGFKYGSIYGLELLELLKSGKAPDGLAFERKAAENIILLALHKIIDIMLKHMGDATSSTTAMALPSVLVASLAFICTYANLVRPVVALVLDKLLTPGVMVALHLALCAIYSVGSELWFGRVKSSVDLQQMCVCWAIHFVWGLGLPALMMLFTTGSKDALLGGGLARVPTGLEDPLPWMALGFWAFSLCLDEIALLLRYHAIRDMAAAGGADAYTRRVAIPKVGGTGAGADGGHDTWNFFCDKDDAVMRKDSKGTAAAGTTQLAKPAAPATKGNGKTGAGTGLRVITSGIYASMRHPAYAAHIAQQTANACLVAAVWIRVSAIDTLFSSCCFTVVACSALAFWIFRIASADEEAVLEMLSSGEENGARREPTRKLSSADQEASPEGSYAAYRRQVPTRFYFDTHALSASINFLFEIQPPLEQLMGVGSRLFTAVEEWALGVRDGGNSTRRIFTRLVGHIQGVNVEYINPLTEPELVEQVLLGKGGTSSFSPGIGGGPGLGSNKGSFLEMLSACPAWDPVRSLESVDSVESARLRGKLAQVMSALQVEDRVATVTQLAWERFRERVAKQVEARKLKRAPSRALTEEAAELLESAMQTNTSSRTLSLSFGGASSDSRQATPKVKAARREQPAAGKPDVDSLTNHFAQSGSGSPPGKKAPNLGLGEAQKKASGSSARLAKGADSMSNPRLTESSSLDVLLDEKAPLVGFDEIERLIFDICYFLFLNSFPSEAEYQLACEAIEAWKAEIAMKKRAPKAMKTRLVSLIRLLIKFYSPFLGEGRSKDPAAIEKLLEECQTGDLPLEDPNPANKNWHEKPQGERDQHTAGLKTVGFDVMNIGHLSCILQPLLISPCINFPDLLSGVKKLLSEPGNRPWIAAVAGDETENLQVADCLLLESIRLQHPFPILERYTEEGMSFDSSTIFPRAEGSQGGKSAYILDNANDETMQNRGIANGDHPMYSRVIPPRSQIFIEYDGIPVESSSGMQGATCPMSGMAGVASGCPMLGGMPAGAGVMKDNTKFDPSRWCEYVGYGKNSAACPLSSCAFKAIPFGAGARRCMGQHLARGVLKRVLHHLCKEFPWTGGPGGRSEVEAGTNEGQFTGSESPHDFDGDSISTATPELNAQGQAMAPRASANKLACSASQATQATDAWPLINNWTDFQPSYGHKYSGRTNDDADDADPGFVAATLLRIIFWSFVMGIRRRGASFVQFAGTACSLIAVSFMAYVVATWGVRGGAKRILAPNKMLNDGEYTLLVERADDLLLAGYSLMALSSGLYAIFRYRQRAATPDISGKTGDDANQTAKKIEEIHFTQVKREFIQHAQNLGDARSTFLNARPRMVYTKADAGDYFMMLVFTAVISDWTFGGPLRASHPTYITFFSVFVIRFCCPFLAIVFLLRHGCGPDVSLPMFLREPKTIIQIPITFMWHKITNMRFGFLAQVAVFALEQVLFRSGLFDRLGLRQGAGHLLMADSAGGSLAVQLCSSISFGYHENCASVVVWLFEAETFGVFSLSFGLLAAVRTAFFLDHLRQHNHVFDFLAHTGWKKTLRFTPPGTPAIVDHVVGLAHALITGLWTHVLTVTPWFCILNAMHGMCCRDGSLDPALCLLALVSHTVLRLATGLEQFLLNDFEKHDLNEWFVRDHWLAHHLRFDFCYLHGPHHDALPLSLIAVADNGPLEGLARHALGHFDSWCSPLFAAFRFTKTVIRDMVGHQYVPGVLPYAASVVQYGVHHVEHHYLCMYPLGNAIGVEKDPRNGVGVEGWLSGGAYGGNDKEANRVWGWFVQQVEDVEGYVDAGEKKE